MPTALKNEPLLTEIESLLSELIEWLANQRRNRRGVNNGYCANAVAQALHHDGRDHVNAMSIDQAFLTACRGILFIIHHEGANRAVVQDGVDQQRPR